jgi:hypothetical protein
MFYAPADDEQLVVLHQAGGADIKAFREMMIEAALKVSHIPDANKRLRILRRAYADTDVPSWAPRSRVVPP